MSWTLKLSSITNDLIISDGTFETVNGAAEVRQRVTVALQHLLYEYFLNVPGGMPWYTDILGSKFNNSTLSNLIRQQILSVPGVLRILNFTLTYDSVNRIYRPKATIVVQRNSLDTIDYISIDGIFISV